MKRTITNILAVFLASCLLAGCTNSNSSVPSSSSETASEASETTEQSTKETVLETKEEEDLTDVVSEISEDEETNSSDERTLVRIGSLKGPTSMGLVFLMEMAEGEKTTNNYEFTMVTAADELLPKVINKELDIALVPANVASILYNRTDGGVSVIDINTLGVLYVVTADSSIQSIRDLKGHTVYMTGKGTTPDYVIQYLLTVNGLSDSDVNLEYKSEPTEVAALLKEDDNAIGILPQPFAAVACAQMEEKNIQLLDLTKEWDEVQKQEEHPSRLVTGVTIVRNEFLSEHTHEVDAFLQEHEKSATFTKDQPKRAAELVVKTGIIEKAPIAEQALPKCNITCITGKEMKDALSGYLQVLFDQEPTSVGGKLPEENFYYEPIIAD